MLFASRPSADRPQTLAHVLMLTAATLMLFATPAAANLVRNPGFEADTDSDGIPDGWQREWNVPDPPPDGGSWYRTDETSHGGDYSVHGACETAADEGMWVQHGIALPDGTDALRVSAWIRAVDIRTAAGVVVVRFRDADGAEVSGRIPVNVGIDRDWTRYVGYVEVPEGAETFDVEMWIGHAFVKCGSYWFDDIEVTPVDEAMRPVMLYGEHANLPAFTNEEQARGFMAFSRPATRVTMPSVVPDAAERLETLRLAAAPGQMATATLGLFAIRPQHGLRIATTAFQGPAGRIAPEAASIRVAALHERLGQPRWGVFLSAYKTVPLFFEARETYTVPMHENRMFQVMVDVPADAAPGAYTGKLMVEAPGAEPVALPVELTIHPFTLADPEGITFAMYTRMRDDPALIDETFADMRAHGMTSVALTGASGLPLRVEDGAVVVSWTGESLLEKNIAGYVRAGFPEPMVWLMGGDIRGFCQRELGGLDTEAFGEGYVAVVRAIEARREEMGWPAIIYQPIDEPYEHESYLPTAGRLLELLKEAGVTTETNGMNGKWANFTDEFYRLSDVINLHDGPMLDRHVPVDMDAWWQFHERARADGKLLWFYNIDLMGWHPESVRFMTGFGLWKAGAQGIIEWCYMAPVNPGQPELVYQNPAAMLYRYPATARRAGGPTLNYEAAREGTYDYRYLLTLRRLVDRARASGDAGLAREANRLWGPIQAMLDRATFDGCTGVASQGHWAGPNEVLPDGLRVVRGEFELDNAWAFGDYDALRGRIADAITALETALAD